MKNEYSNLIKKVVGNKEFEIYSLPTFLTEEQKNSLSNIIVHYWKEGDKLIYLADEYYSDSSLWWIIAMYNGIVYEHDLEYGEQIYIPMDIATILDYLKENKANGS